MKTQFIRSALLGTIALATSACVTDRQLLISVPVASMSQTSLPKGKGVSQGKPGKARFCEGDKAISTKERTVGVLDELIKRGEMQSKSQFLTDVQLFTAEGGTNCFELEYKAGVVGAPNAPQQKGDAPAAEEVN